MTEQRRDNWYQQLFPLLHSVRHFDFTLQHNASLFDQLLALPSSTKLVCLRIRLPSVHQDGGYLSKILDTIRSPPPVLQTSSASSFRFHTLRST